MQAEIENARCAHDCSILFTRVVFPDPEGAVITIILPVDNGVLKFHANKMNNSDFLAFRMFLHPILENEQMILSFPGFFEDDMAFVKSYHEKSPTESVWSGF